MGKGTISEKDYFSIKKGLSVTHPLFDSDVIQLPCCIDVNVSRKEKRREKERERKSAE